MVKKVRCIENRKAHLEAIDITHGKEYEVLMEDDGFYRLRDDSGGLSWLLMKRFEEVKELTLQDLLAKAKELYDKGILRGYGEEENAVIVKTGSIHGRIFGEGRIGKGLEYLQSLEVETFKIETVEDLGKIKPRSRGVLLNGVEFEVISLQACIIRGVGFQVAYLLKGSNTRLYFEELKGATITQ